MKLPFTIEQFLSVFAAYNQTVFPMQIVLNLMAVVAIVLIFVNKNISNKLISMSLGFFWLWAGLVYHIMFFSSINKAAYFFGSLFLIQSFMFIFIGTVKEKLNFQFDKNFYGITGSVFIIYALVIYPVVGYLLGHIYPNAPTFGLPCPVTIFTFGILLLTISKVPVYLIIIPVLWSLTGLSAAIGLKISEDYGLAIAGILGTILLLAKNKKLVKSD